MIMENLYGIIDVGSNSVRLMITNGCKSEKLSIMTRLAEGIKEGFLSKTAIMRTADAVAFLKGTATVRGVKEIYAFATAAVRNAKNGDEFCRTVFDACGINVDVISGDTEAEIGYLGALGEKDGGLIDVGGASSEVIVVKNNRREYVYSLDVGAVKIKDICGQSRSLAERYIAEKLKEYGKVPKTDFYAVGGTATSVAAILQSLDRYDANKIQGYFVKLSDLSSLVDKLYSMSVEERKGIKGLQPRRAEIIAGGALLLFSIAKYLGVDGFTVSESDNLEGYFAAKVGKL